MGDFPSTPCAKKVFLERLKGVKKPPWEKKISWLVGESLKFNHPSEINRPSNRKPYFPETLNDGSNSTTFS